jgi:hypothetical protein
MLPAEGSSTRVRRSGKGIGRACRAHNDWVAVSFRAQARSWPHPCAGGQSAPRREANALRNLEPQSAALAAGCGFDWRRRSYSRGTQATSAITRKPTVPSAPPVILATVPGRIVVKAICSMAQCHAKSASLRLRHAASDSHM